MAQITLDLLSIEMINTTTCKILTFDLEEWFHLLHVDGVKDVNKWNDFEVRIFDNTDRILELLDETGHKATFFCVGWIGEKYPQLISKIHSQGHEIASHTFSHRVIYEQKIEEFRQDVEKSMSVLGNITGEKVVSFRAPGFSLLPDTKWAFEVLADLGIQNDCSLFPQKNLSSDWVESARPYIISVNNEEILEFPVNKVSLFGKKIALSGGGYFRLYPYPIIKHWIKSTDYLMTYFHPRDFDAGQPVLEGISKTKKFKSYYGLDGAFDKLSRLLKDHRFIRLADAVQLTGESELTKVTI